MQGSQVFDLACQTVLIDAEDVGAVREVRGGLGVVLVDPKNADLGVGGEGFFDVRIVGVHHHGYMTANQKADSRDHLRVVADHGQ